MEDQKIRLVIDADDVLLNTSEAIIAILNKSHNINPPKSYFDLTDCQYRSIYSAVTPQEISDIVKSEEFIDRLTIKSVELKAIFEKYRQKIDIVAVSKSPDINYSAMLVYFFPDILITESEKYITNKQKSIRVSTKCDALAVSDAEIKVLLTDGKKVSWNDTHRVCIENRYDCTNTQELAQIVEFFITNPMFITR